MFVARGIEKSRGGLTNRTSIGWLLDAAVLPLCWASVCATPVPDPLA